MVTQASPDRLTTGTQPSLAHPHTAPHTARHANPPSHRREGGSRRDNLPVVLGRCTAGVSPAPAGSTRSAIGSPLAAAQTLTLQALWAAEAVRSLEFWR